MEVSSKWSKGDLKERHKCSYDDFTVLINDRRVLSLFAYDDAAATKWLSDVRKTSRRTKNPPFVVGVSVDRDIYYLRQGVPDTPYDVLTLYVGSHCLVYNLPGCGWNHGRYLRAEQTNKVLRDFLADPNVMFVAMDAAEVSARLERFHSLRMARSVDARALAVRLRVDEKGRVAGKRPKELSVDDVAKVLLDKRMDPVRPEWGLKRSAETWMYGHSRWGYRKYDYQDVGKKFVQFQTLDAFFCYEIGMKYHDDLKKLSSSSS